MRRSVCGWGFLRLGGWQQATFWSGRTACQCRSWWSWGGIVRRRRGAEAERRRGAEQPVPLPAGGGGVTSPGAGSGGSGGSDGGWASCRQHAVRSRRLVRNRPPSASRRHLPSPAQQSARPPVPLPTVSRPNQFNTIAALSPPQNPSPLRPSRSFVSLRPQPPLSCHLDGPHFRAPLSSPAHPPFSPAPRYT